jgi:Tol biopolymer transport system component
LLSLAGAGPEDPEAAKPAVRVTRLVSPDGRREAHGLYVIRPDGEATSKIVVAEADGTGRRAVDVKLEGAAEVYWYGNDRLAYSTDVPRRRRGRGQAHSGPDAAPSVPLYTIVDLDGRTAETIRLPEECDPLYHALSPDGRSVAYCGRLTAGEDEKYQYGLFVVDVATGKVRNVLKEAVKTLPAWSPDSRKLAIGAAGGYVKDYPLTVIEVETGQAEAVGCNGVGAAWSPDGQALAFTTEVVQGGSWGAGIPFDGRIGVWDLTKKTMIHVSPPGVNVHDKDSGRWELAGSHRPVWSPDGRRLAYRRSHSIQGGRVDLQSEETWVVNRDGTGARKVLNHQAKVAWLPDGKTLLWLNEGRVGRVDVDAPVALGPTPSRPIGAFSVTGTIVDEIGRPLPGVAVTVARGMFTLFPTEPVVTDEQGHYTAHFGPGMDTTDGINLQPAIVHASKPGYYEKNLCRAGNLGMAFMRPEGTRTERFVAIVYPGHPYRLDLTMLPAARVQGRLVDLEKKPLAGISVWLDGESYPATNVLASAKTDEQGRFRFVSVPLLPYRFSIGSGRVAIRSDPMPFREAGERPVVLVYRALDAVLDWSTAPDPQ